jgi:hypothetical protein
MDFYNFIQRGQTQPLPVSPKGEAFLLKLLYADHKLYNLSQKHHVALRERSLRPKSLVFSRQRPFAFAQGDIFEMTCSHF